MFKLISLILVGCTGTSANLISEIKLDASAPAIERMQDAASFDAAVEEATDACIPVKVLASEVLRINKDCPPEIIDDPHWIPKWDPGPVIKEK